MARMKEIGLHNYRNKILSYFTIILVIPRILADQKIYQSILK